MDPNKGRHPQTIARERIRILLCEMAPMLHDIINQTIATQSDLCIAAKVTRKESLLEAVVRTNAGVLIASDVTARPEQYEELLRKRPHLKVLEITAKDGHGVLYEMHPRRVPLGQMSPVALLDIIRKSAWPTSSSGVAMK